MQKSTFVYIPKMAIFRKAGMREGGLSFPLAFHFFHIHRVRGQSGFFNLVLTERNMQVEFDLKLSVYSLGVDI